MRKRVLLDDSVVGHRQGQPGKMLFVGEPSCLCQFDELDAAIAIGEHFGDLKVRRSSDGTGAGDSDQRECNVVGNADSIRHGVPLIASSSVLPRACRSAIESIRYFLLHTSRRHP